jgi:hypothetical protein
MMSGETKPKAAIQGRKGFCIYIDTVFQGAVPVVRDAVGNPFVYPTRKEAERDIADDIMGRINQFLDGERDFDDAITVEEYIVEVVVLPDGSVIDGNGIQSQCSR